jgi:hypothetical protein
LSSVGFAQTNGAVACHEPTVEATADSLGLDKINDEPGNVTRCLSRSELRKVELAINEAVKIGDAIGQQKAWHWSIIRPITRLHGARVVVGDALDASLIERIASDAMMDGAGQVTLTSLLPIQGSGYSPDGRAVVSFVLTTGTGVELSQGVLVSRYGELSDLSFDHAPKLAPAGVMPEDVGADWVIWLQPPVSMSVVQYSATALPITLPFFSHYFFPSLTAFSEWRRRKRTRARVIFMGTRTEPPSGCEFLVYFLLPRRRKEIWGDLYEEYTTEIVPLWGKGWAAIWMWRQVLGSIYAVVAGPVKKLAIRVSIVSGLIEMLHILRS